MSEDGYITHKGNNLVIWITPYGSYIGKLGDKFGVAELTEAGKVLEGQDRQGQPIVRIAKLGTVQCHGDMPTVSISVDTSSPYYQAYTREMTGLSVSNQIPKQ